MIQYLQGLEYGNNVPVEGWIEIAADYDDWCKLQRQWFFRALMKYLQREGTLKEDYMPDLRPSTPVDPRSARFYLGVLCEPILQLVHKDNWFLHGKKKSR